MEAKEREQLEQWRRLYMQASEAAHEHFKLGDVFLYLGISFAVTGLPSRDPLPTQYNMYATTSPTVNPPVVAEYFNPVKGEWEVKLFHKELFPAIERLPRLGEITWFNKPQTGG